MNAFYKFFTLGNAPAPSSPTPRTPTKASVDIQPEYILKIVVLGAPDVGKTSLVERYCHQGFNKTYTPTVGIEMNSVELKRKNKVLQQKFGMGIRCSFFDVPHTELRGKHTPKILDGAHGYIIVFDISEPKSIQAVDQWRALIPNTNTNVLLVANKCDRGHHVIKPTNLDAYVRDAGFIGWHMTDCRKSASVREMFNYLIDRILRQFWKKYEGLPLGKTKRKISDAPILSTPTRTRSMRNGSMASDLDESESSQLSEDYFSIQKFIDDGIEMNPFEARQLMRPNTTIKKANDAEVNSSSISQFIIEIKAFYGQLREKFASYEQNNPHLSKQVLESLQTEMNNEETILLNQIIPVYQFFNEQSSDPVFVMQPDRLQRLFVELRRSFFIQTISKWTQLWYSLRMENVIQDVYHVPMVEQSFEARKGLVKEKKEIDLNGEVSVTFPHLNDTFPVPSQDVFPALSKMEQQVVKLVTSESNFPKDGFIFNL